MFNKKNIIITGATGGIGSKTAESFFSEGANLILLGKNKKKLELLKKKLLKKKTGKILCFACDNESYDDIKKVFNLIFNDFKNIDIFVNNAGILRDSFIGMITEDSILQTLKINLIAPIILTQLFSKLMKSGGSIINISSIIGTKGNIGQSVYGASKAGLIGFTLSSSKELASRGIRVNAIAPGLIQTKMISSIPKIKKQQLLSNISLKRIGLPEDVASLIKFLASSHSSYITGETIHVDGGLLI